MGQVPAKNILSYWLLKLGPEKWFQPSAEIDEDIHKQFYGIYTEARRVAENRLEDLPLTTADDYLAAIILFDQFPRNMFRGLPQSFATDPLARGLSHLAIAKGFDAAAPLQQRILFYLPFEHSEDAKDQALCVALVKERCPVGSYLEYAELHLEIIKRFGRFPHRNAILGRPSSPEELAYLAESGHNFGASPPQTKR